MRKLFVGRNRILTIPIVVLIGLFLFPITILLIIGWLIYKKVPNKKIKIAGLSIIGILVLIFGAAYVSSLTNLTPPKPPQEAKNESAERIPSSTTTSVLIPSASPTQEPKNLLKVTKVIDGDTIELEGGQRVRFIGINTPETVDPNKSVECFGKEASGETKVLLDGQQVRLEKDISETDKYGRLLRYVWLGDSFINELLV